jgi:hypothetical protein
VVNTSESREIRMAVRRFITDVFPFAVILTILTYPILSVKVRPKIKKTGPDPLDHPVSRRLLWFPPKPESRLDSQDNKQFKKVYSKSCSLSSCYCTIRYLASKPVAGVSMLFNEIRSECMKSIL